MKFTILCDELPKKCDECPFWQESLEKRSDSENEFEIVSNCAVGGESSDLCPLTEVKTIWDTEENG